MNLLDYFIIPKCIHCNKQIDNSSYLCDECTRMWTYERMEAKDNFIYLARYDKMKNSIARSLVLKIKSNNDIHTYKFLADELAYVIHERIMNCEDYIITNVPRTKEKIRESGFDQSQLLSKMIAKKLNIKYMSMLENKGKQVQKLLDFASRQINAGKSYVIKNKFANNLHGYKIILLDDVTTSGSTLNVCRQILINNGAMNVEYATICRCE